MKKTQIKDTLRNIVRQGVSYLSIIVIAFLGVTTFLGADYSARALRVNGSEMYDRQSFRDVELVSTLLFTGEDLEAIRQTEGVADAEAVWQTPAHVAAGDTRTTVNVISLTERINLPQVEEGHLPTSATECAVEQRLADEMNWHVGDRIELTDASGVGQYLSGGSFEIVGIVNYPDHTNLSVPETPYVMVTSDAFDRAALDGCFMKTEVVIEKAENVDRFGREYENAVAAVYGRLNDLASARASERSDTLRTVYQGQIDDAQAQLDEARAELDSARGELDEGWAALADGEQELLDGREQLDQSKTELDAAKTQLESARSQLNTAKTQLDASESALRSADAQLKQASTQLTSGWNELEDAKAGIRDGIRGAIEELYGGDTSEQIPWASKRGVDPDSADVTAMDFWITDTFCCDLNRSLESNIRDFIYSDMIPDEVLLQCYENETGTTDGFDADSARDILAVAAVAAAESYDSDYDSLASACGQWDVGHAEYLSGLSNYQAGVARFRSAKAEYDANERQYRAGVAAYEAGVAQYEQGIADLAAGEKELENSRKRLEDGETTYQAGLEEYADGETRVDEARAQLAGLEPCRWLLFDAHGSASFVQLVIGSENLSNMEMTFSLLFILVGALVIFATVSKMIDEQRSQVGTTKALGFFNREIFTKYLAFGVSATVLGTVLGILAARFVMEGFVLNGYGNYFVFDLTKPRLFAVPTLVVLAAGILLAVAATWVACTKLLRTPAVRLMQPKVPEGVKKSTGGKRVLSLYSRLILLNMRTDLRRVIVTIVSVAGCCALVVIGFTLRSAVNGSMERQYTEIVDYDLRVSFDGEVTGCAGQIEQRLTEAGTSYAAIYDATITYRITDNQVGELFCGDLAAIDRLYHLRDWKTGEPLKPTDEGILIQRRLAEIYGLDVGSEFEIAIGGTKTATVRVAGVFEHFIGRPMVMSPAYYEEIYGERIGANAFLVRLNGVEAQTLEDTLRTVDGYNSCTPSDADKAFFEASTSVINTLVALFIFMAAIMAGVVLMNLTNMYVLQKKRELTIMRVNGFSVREVIGYMTRESVLTTVLGILLGLTVGSGIAYKILRSMEQAFFQFDRRVSLFAWLMGASITVVFAVVINVLALRRVKHLKLTDVT